MTTFNFHVPFNFSVPEDTQRLWQQISSCWSHQNLPDGQRFLGSVRINQEDTDKVLSVVGYNLRRIGSGSISYERIHERFPEPERNWLKILTFALSEYAYYYSGFETDSGIERGFWHGFCEKLKLRHTDKIENSLREIVGEGFELLGLVQAKGGYRYVSTLWLQSGIPQRNISHFSRLVQEFSNEYGWWEIAHTCYEDISEELLNFCELKHKHRKWRTLINFLKVSCSDQEQKEAEPISGQLLQGIAIIAVELERQGTLPKEIKNDNEREKLLGNYYLPNNFFLRNWDNLIQVLTPRHSRQGSSRRIFNCRPKALSLVLDINDSLNIQLVLPEQNIWKKEWDKLGGTFCQIPEATWEGSIPSKGKLMIPEKVVDIKKVAECWIWQLLDHNHKCLNEWKLEGIANKLPYVVFNAFTGDRLNLESDDFTIRGIQEIIFFTPKCMHIELDEGIEILDSCVPSSITEWRGQHLKLITKQSSIDFHAKNTHNILITWVESLEEQPRLIGLKLKGKKSVYIEIPRIFYPPVEREISLNISIENIAEQQTIIMSTKNILPNNSWQPIILDEINKPGKYEVRLWEQLNRLNRWSYKFEIQEEYQINDELNNIDLLISSSSQYRLQKLPVITDSSTKFWAEEFKIEGLFPLEIISLSLRDKRETVFSQFQADPSGNLLLSLAHLYDSLSSDSDFYALGYQRLGGKIEPLIEMQTTPLSISWVGDNQEVKISGLFSHENYFLSCWNLLLPANLPLKIQVISSNEKTITIPLKLPPGIYHIQLFDSLKKPHNLGWWCGSNQYDLPDEALENDDLANYCYTILDNESDDDFIKAAEKFDYDYQFLENIINDFHNSYFPKWLNNHCLIQKLQALLDTLKTDMKIKSTQQQKAVNNNLLQAQNSPSINTSIKWLLIELTSVQKREFVKKLIEKRIDKYELRDKISSIKLPEEPYENFILLECKNAGQIKTCIQSLEYVKKITDLSQNDAEKILNLC